MLRSILSHSLIYGATTMMMRGTSLVLLLVLPHFMPPADYGALGMIMAVSAVALLFVPLEVSQGLARYYATSPLEERSRYAGTAWLFTCAAFILFVALGEIFAAPLCNLVLGDLGYLPAFRIAIPMIAASGLFYFIQAQFRWEFRAADFTVVSLVMTLTTLGLALSLAMTADRALNGVVTGQLLGATAAVLIGLVRLRSSLFAGFSAPRLKEMLVFSLPLVPASLALFLSQYASRLMLNGMSSLEDVGIFTFGSQIASIATLAVLGIQAALTPLIMAHHEEPGTPATIARAFEAFSALSLLLCLFLGLFSPEFIILLGVPDYAAAAPLVLIIAPAVVLSGMYVFAPGFLIAKKTVWQLGVSLTSAIVCIAANYVLIRLWGIKGAAIASLLGSITLITLWFSLSQRLYPVPVRWLPVALTTITAAAAGALALLLPMPGVAAAIAFKLAMLAATTGVAVASGTIPLGALIGAARAAFTDRRAA